MTDPCKECPFRIVAPAGWLGPYSAEEWIHLVQSDQIIACHLHVFPAAHGVNNWDGTQCAGAADYRANVSKSPRDPSVIIGKKNPDVFSTPMEFLDHHSPIEFTDRDADET